MSFLPLALLAVANPPCTDADAHKMPGSWKHTSDDVAMADSTLAPSARPALLRKADRAVDLLTKSIPDPPGIEAKVYRMIRGGPYFANGPVPFGVNALFLGYYCVEDTKSYPEIRGTIQHGGETETWIYVDFNSLGWLSHEWLTPDKDLTTKGMRIYFLPKTSGELAGSPIYLPTVHKEKSEAIVLGGEPYRAVTREAYLKARVRLFDRKLAKLEKGRKEIVSSGNERALQGIDRTKAQLEADRTELTRAQEALSDEEKKAPAVVSSVFVLPSKGKLFQTEAEGGRTLVTINPDLFAARDPRDTIRVITVFWKWDPDDPPKAAVIRRFKEHFDFAALREQIGK